MWLIYFVTAFNWSVTGNLAPYILSDFEAHSLVTVIGIVSGVLGAALYMPIAKMLNLFDRSYGFLFLVFLSIVGLITSAVCKNVQTYAAAQVSPQNKLQVLMAGIHNSRIHGYDPLHRYSHRRYISPQEPRSCIRLYLFSLYHYHLRRA